MSDKNIEIIKAIQQTGQCPENQTQNMTQILVESAPPCIDKTRNVSSITIFDAQNNDDK